MISRLRSHFGTAGLVVAIVALIAALAGGAIAATSSAHHHKKKVKVVRGPRGKRGPQGPQGPEGPAGPTGPAGANGTNGNDGAKGATGATGATGNTGNTGNPGESVITEPASVGECPEGGTRFIVGEVEEALCNGKEGATGATGATGPPGPLTSILPKGVTMTGIVGGDTPAGTTSFLLAIPFTFQVEEEDLFPFFEGKLKLTEGGSTTGCPGNNEHPAADPGYLCMYLVGSYAGSNLKGEIEPDSFSTAGVLLRLPKVEKEASSRVRVAWAYQRPE